MYKLDVIIPVYNSCPYLENLLDRFKTQTRKDFCLIFVNDGSTDNSLEYLEKKKNSFDFEIIILNQSNKGVSVARNNGLSFAKHNIVSFLDSDDYPEYNYVENILNEFESDETIDAFAFSVNSVKEKNRKRNPIEVNQKDGIYSNIDLLHSFLESRFNIFIFSIAVKRSLIVDNEIYYPEGYKNLEDVNYCFQLLSASKKIMIKNVVLYNYLIRESSATTRYNVLTDWEKSLEVMELLKNVFRKTCPSFADYFEQYGISKIVWSLTWQSVKVSKKYKRFLEFTRQISSKYHLKKMVTFPSKKVSISSKLFTFSPRLFYFLVLIYGRNKNRSC